jgi:hypothetical protein
MVALKGFVWIAGAHKYTCVSYYVMNILESCVCRTQGEEEKMSISIHAALAKSPTHSIRRAHNNVNDGDIIKCVSATAVCAAILPSAPEHNAHVLNSLLPAFSM